MIPEERMCWVFLFATLVALFYHQKEIVDLLKVYSETYGDGAINSIFRVENLLKEKKGTVVGTYEKDGVEYEMIERKIEKGKNE